MIGVRGLTIALIPIVGIGGACDAESISRGTKMSDRQELWRLPRKTLIDRIEQLEATLQEVWDCEADFACPNCKLIARQALENKDE
jgi:hypothetical protein